MITVNLAYHSFTEIRQSALAREMEALDSIRKPVSEQSHPTACIMLHAYRATAA
jgi:hypothetical protein